jgi:hypothetical protein
MEGRRKGGRAEGRKDIKEGYQERVSRKGIKKGYQKRMSRKKEVIKVKDEQGASEQAD